MIIKLAVIWGTFSNDEVCISSVICVDPAGERYISISICISFLYFTLPLQTALVSHPPRWVRSSGRPGGWWAQPSLPWSDWPSTTVLEAVTAVSILGILTTLGSRQGPQSRTLQSTSESPIKTLLLLLTSQPMQWDCWTLAVGPGDCAGGCVPVRGAERHDLQGRPVGPPRYLGCTADHWEGQRGVRGLRHRPGPGCGVPVGQTGRRKKSIKVFFPKFCSPIICDCWLSRIVMEPHTPSLFSTIPPAFSTMTSWWSSSSRSLATLRGRSRPWWEPTPSGPPTSSTQASMESGSATRR